MTAQYSPVPVARPLLPPAAALLPYLQQIDENGWYANHGPLSRLLQCRLANYWGVEDASVALVSSATSGLNLALQASGARPGRRCLMPSWTFVASAGAVAAAGLIPHFVDISPSSWAPSPDEMERVARQHDVGAILVVSPFGAPLDLRAWDELRKRTGIPVIIDAAAAFDTIRSDGPMPVGECPVVVSLHATKVFGVGEGGALICRDADFTNRARSLAQFGFAGTREAKWPGWNAKMSEYAAAVGLAQFDAWSNTRARWRRVTDQYRKLLPRKLGLPPQFGAGWVSSTLTVLWPEDRPDLNEILASAGVATRQWWGPGCHAHKAYRDCPTEELLITPIYARRAVGLPFSQELTDQQIEFVSAALHRALGRKPAARTDLTTMVGASI